MMKFFLIPLIFSSFVFWSCKERNEKDWKNAQKEQNSTLTEDQFQPEIKTKANLNKNVIDFKGSYNICKTNLRNDSIKSEICYEITIIAGLASIDANTSLCKGNYKINQFQNNEINLINVNDGNCHFKIKKENNTYFIKGIGDEITSNEWIELDKTK
ncbi:hypothetical protein [Chryseobacterium viscerum]|uniref:hypothetical protein n=1 Tax=Chryseobacterium viscerum TaxID=1037377 RepID=UPI002222C08E|nr:hypothetical protein [Chryseobacterium viscerum]MCW1963017.1 hypothetical protein [Chryseobacterium viscerum]